MAETATVSEVAADTEDPSSSWDQITTPEVHSEALEAAEVVLVALEAAEAVLVVSEAVPSAVAAAVDAGRPSEGLSQPKTNQNSS